MEALHRIREQELSISLQRDIREILRHFEWRMNTQETRQEIATRLETILEDYRKENNIYNYRVTCDNTNNRPEDIDNHRLKSRVTYEYPKGVIKILDITIEPQRLDQTAFGKENEGRQVFCDIDPYGEENW